MGARPGRPQSSHLNGALLLSVAAHSLEGGEACLPTAVLLRVRLPNGDQRTLHITSKCVVRMGVVRGEDDFLDVAALLDRNRLGAFGTTSDWFISAMQVTFCYTPPAAQHDPPSGQPEVQHVKLTGRGLLRATWHQEFELWNWEPNSKRMRCPLCREAFVSTRWRHHCRACGRVVCGACSEHVAVVPDAPLSTHCTVETTCQFVMCMNDTRDSASAAVRVCNDCYYGPVMATPLPDGTPSPPLAVASSHMSGCGASSDGCFYDDMGRLHIKPPRNVNTLLLHYNRAPQWHACSTDDFSFCFPEKQGRGAPRHQ